MRRREFLAASLAMAAALGNGCAHAQGGRPKVRAAIIIGVNKPGDLTPLNGAASGARAVAKWLRGEGFDPIKVFADDDGPVRASAIADAVAELVDRGTLDQLVVYFAGHGFIGTNTEFWMLSNAPRDANEAISLLESKVLARRSAIPSVVFISDACRSRPDSIQTQSMRGSVIFPNPGVMAQVHSNVDVFLATLVGEPSFEVPISESTGAYEGVYTAAFLAAFQRPDDDMVRAVDDFRVVPNNHLEAYLEREVRKRVFALKPTYQQTPDAEVVSGDTTYIARVLDPASPATPAAAPVSAPVVPTRGLALALTPAPASAPAPVPMTPPHAAPTIRDVANAELASVGVRGPHPNVLVAPGAIEQLNAEAGFSKARDTILRAADSQPLDADTGFTITGARVDVAVATPGIRTQVLSHGEEPSQRTHVRVDMGGVKAASVAIRFADGSGTVVAALRGFIGHIVVDGPGVSNVSFFPSRNSGLWLEYKDQRERIGRLHAAVATAARYGVFRIEGSADSKAAAGARLADTIRVLKGIDPTLGLYAAYAYSEAGLQNQVRSVREYMRGDLQADLFDVAMLSGALAGRNPDRTGSTVPFCPMLSQGWGYLRVQDVHLPEEVNAAQDHLRPALWTTFDGDGIRILLAAIQAGKLR